MLHILESRVTQAVSAHIKTRYGVDIPVLIEQPKQASFGELALPAAFQLAKQLKKAPRAIALEIAAELPPIDGVGKLEVAGNGFINVHLDRAWLTRRLIEGAPQHAAASTEKIIVEHTNINPNKAAHIGHLRNAILGDTFVRMQRAAGLPVEVQNYIDNTGVQVADVVVGFHFVEKKSLAEVEDLVAQDKFDFLCWELYARVSAYYDTHPETKPWRAETLHAIEAGEGEIAALGVLVADAIVKCHVKTMLRLGVVYDVLPRESEILHMKFWAAAFERFKETGAIYFETEGKNKGCWVMPGTAFSEHREDEDSKVIVRSNGTVTYVGKDMAYQLWKFGLLGKDFLYQLHSTYPNGHPLYVSGPTGEPGSFGRGTRVYNVIDSRQSYLQDVVVAGLRALGYKEQAANSIHFSYEMVALSPRTCEELGIALSDEDKAKSHVEVSGRKGLGVKADDLIDKLIEAASAEVEDRVKKRETEATAEQRREVAEAIAIGALRYFMLKYTRNSVIAFDFQEALAFVGESGPYVQYNAVRTRNILARLTEPLPDFAATLDAALLSRLLADDALWQCVLAAGRTGSALEKALASGEPSHMARHAFQLAQIFSSFYDHYPVIHEADPGKRAFLLWLTTAFRDELTRVADILGIPVPAFM